MSQCMHAMVFCAMLIVLTQLHELYKSNYKLFLTFYGHSAFHPWLSEIPRKWCHEGRIIPFDNREILLTFLFLWQFHLVNYDFRIGRKNNNNFYVP